MVEEFYINSDGVRLHAKLERADDKHKCPLCILIHGFTGHMEEDHIIAARQAMLDAGVSVLRVEMYGHGGSDGTFFEHTLYKWITNALAAVHYAKGLDHVSDLYLCGHSQGGMLTMLVGGMCADYFKAIIPLSPAWKIPEAARNGRMFELSIDLLHIPEKIVSDEWEISGDYVRVAQTIHVEDEIARFRGPVLIVHGDEDEIAPYADSETAASMYADARLVRIQGDDHCFTRHLDKMADAIRDFFEKEKS